MVSSSTSRNTGRTPCRVRLPRARTGLLRLLLAAVVLSAFVFVAVEGKGKGKTGKKAAAKAKAAAAAAGGTIVANTAKSGPPKSKRGNTEKTVPLRTHSLYAPYVDSDLQNRWFDFGGSTIINTNKHVRLTQDRASQAGWLWSRLALAPNSFEVEFEFRVDGKSSTLYGDGLAMWFTKARAGTGPAFGSADYWDGLGIFFDTYANSRHSYSFPRIYAIKNDGTKAYEVGKDGQSQEIGGCSVSGKRQGLDFRRTDVTAKARFTYFRGKFTELAIQHDKWDQWTTCFVLDGFELPANPFLGFSALTGDVSDAHDIISITTSNIAYHPPSVENNNRPPGSRGIPGKAFFSFIGRLLKWFVFLAMIAAAWIGYKNWKKTKSHKRF
ncbi:BZ3500_MvSof-1268-A1-R1_Chr1-3g02202 [Microbotryum saponariae]|uniref:BZ3500_MvSof-1268-A1-R1_Chr1-3g02202 protein n=1 Tax=Microbotryum saponariae TaxID=289078 RepID=A0A2X0KCV8_9BASI|nr:BZ3500_MvSof-1268-A1-R1_Chr1-3g02202 [Microbotryum saponariae]SCZ95641.1 BZ3501_MvSof-1269-A2-R1_Chr1-3g01805 [Microbotryum saponariae]